jgi:acyl-CoA thioester hydrolase
MSETGKRRCQVELVVPFHDLDAMQVVWHGNYLKYFDIARNALFEEAGINLYDYCVKSGFLFPIVRTRAKHTFPLRYRNRFVCTVVVVETRRKIVLDFEIRLADSGKLCARCRSEQVAVRGSGFEMEIMIPEDIQRALNGN